MCVCVSGRRSVVDWYDACFESREMARAKRFQFRLVPHDERFFEMFNRAADNVCLAARAMLELFENYIDVDRKVRRLKDYEHTGDEVTHTIFNALDRSFVTPFERDDLDRLASALDDVVDWIEEASKRIYVYKLREPTQIAKRFARLIVEQAESIQRAVPLLERLKDDSPIRSEIVEIHRLENEADDLLVEALGALYDDVTDVRALVLAVQWADVYNLLEQATDKAEHVGTALESIIVKHA